MAVVSCVEIPRERSQSGKFGETYKYTRGWMVRVDDINTPLPSITDAHKVAFLDPHPDDASCLAMEFQTKPESNSLLHYTVSVTYYAPPKAADGEDGSKPPELLPGIPTVWTATSSVSSAPLVFDAAGKVITNSAGVNIPGLECDRAAFKLSLKRPFGDYSWQPLAMMYTNAVNSDTWFGQPASSWKCQGFSAAPETQNEAGVTRSYWMVSIEFEFRAPQKINNGAGVSTFPGWDFVTYDRGYTGKVDDKGRPGSAATGKNGTIRDTKGQPIKEPVGLSNGVPVEPPAVGNLLQFQIYRALPFTGVFGV